MNDQFGFDLNPFGIDSFAPQQQMNQQQSQQQQQQQQQQQHAYLGTNGMQNNNNNGPCMDNYDPNQVLMQQQQQLSPFNLGLNNGGNKNCSRSSSRHHNTHQMMLPGNIQQQSSRRSSSNSQNSMQQQMQQHLQTGFSDFDPLPMSDKFRNGRSSVQQQLQQQSQSNSNSNLRTQFSYQKQQQQESFRMSSSSGRTTEKASVSSYLSSSISSSSKAQQSSHYKEQQKQRQIQQRHAKPKKEEWLEKLSAKVPGVSLEPMTGTQIVDLLRKRANEVLTRYLPCVDFLVQCQQELRKGLQVATTKQLRNGRYQDTYTPRQFHSQYIAQLPNRFYRKNVRTMSSENLMTAFKELEKLVANARTVESQGCEVVKNTFLGGMKDGESWGLRKWLSKQGGALHICNDTECLSSSCNKLEREAPSTIKLAARLRPLAAAALKKLKSEIPSSYQEQSSAHPYLPFFHRLECALRGMSNFDPEDDDVIEIVDDDEVQELKAKASAAPPPTKRKRSRNSMSGNGNSASAPKKKSTKAKQLAFDDDDDSDIEVLDHKPAPKRSNTKKSSSTTNGDVLDFGFDATVGHNEDESDIMEALMKQLDENDDSINFDIFDGKTSEEGTRNSNKFNAFDLADGLEHIAYLFDANKDETVRPIEIIKETFWDNKLQYASALRLFCEILRSPDCTNAYLESVDEDELIQEGKLPYTEIVKHPLSFRDICSSIFADYSIVDKSIQSSSGILPLETTLEDWNMWKGKELLQAIDLVLLNSLAYGKANDGGGKSSTRSRTNKLRKLLWAGIKEVIDETLPSCGVEEKRRHTPTRRGESSGFVVKKGS